MKKSAEMNVREHFPPPTSVSQEAQALLARGLNPLKNYPALDDIDGWRAHIAAADAGIASLLGDVASRVLSSPLSGIAGFDIRLPHGVPLGGGAILDFHGGALISGSGPFCLASGAGMALKLQKRAWAVDYRMPPDHPYPAAVEDGVTAYKALLEIHSADQIIVSGASAGANIAAATILRARDEGLPLPAAAVLLTPELDLTESGDSFQTNLGLDVFLTECLMPANLLYANGADLSHPYLSPLFGDFEKGFPPTFLSTGTRDLFLSNAVRMHWSLLAADIRAQLYVVEAGPHGGFPMAPEGLALDRELRRFIASLID